jgi:hypothetical protein
MTPIRIYVLLMLFGWLSAASITAAQETTPVAPAPPSVPAPGAAKGDSSSSGKNQRAPLGYLITGTVFTEKALAYPNVRVQIRRDSEKKFRWEAYTNSRGEFAMRVPEGQEYEVVVKVKKYKEVTVKQSAKSGELERRLSIRLELVGQEKDATKK